MAKLAIVPSFDPSSFQRQADLLVELTDNRSKYEGDEWFTLCGFPGHLRWAIDRVRAEVEKTSTKSAHYEHSKPSLSATLDCCILHGLNEIRSLSDIQTLLSLKSEVEGTDAGSLLEMDVLYEWFGTFPITAPNPTGGKTRRQNIQLTNTTKSALHALAGDLGLTASQLGVLAILMTLTTQPFLGKLRLQELEDSLQSFLLRTKLRRNLGQAFLEFMRETWGGEDSSE